MSEQATEPRVETVTVTVNGREITAPKGQLVIDAAESHGVYIPRFCYHPRMKPVGMCRMCIVDIDTGRGPALQPSCMIPVADNMVVDTRSPATVKAQDGVLEFLLINHPLDCPVCDKGGECPLQDQTMAYGPGESRFVEEKRHFEKPIPISDVVYLDRERCILCDRCTRFAKDVAGDPLIHFVNRGNESEVNTFPDHPFASYFSGNTVQICPVGALTAKPYRFRARPWDLDQVESTCTSCSVGCRVAIQSSRNRVLRYLGVDVDPVNWGWLCDKGRFDFEAVNSEDRLSRPLLRREGELAAASWSEALRVAGEALGRARGSTGASAPAGEGTGALGVIGGARLTNEAAYAWAKLVKGVLGTDNVDAQLGDGLPAEVVLGLPRATIDGACAKGGTVVVLAPDLKEELPVLFLRLRDAVTNLGVRIVELSPVETGVTPYSAASLRYRAGEAGALVRGLLDGTGDEAGRLAATLLREAAPLTVVLGRPSIAEGPGGIVDAAAALLEARPDAHFLPALRRANVAGALDMGLAPGLLPGRVTLDAGRARFAASWPTVPPARGLDTAGILGAAAEGRLETLVLLGADPLADFPDRDLATRALAGVRTVVAIDTHPNASVRQADIVLPAAGYAETDGTTTNLEGRVSLLGQKVTPPGTARPDWMIAAELALRVDADLGLESIADVRAEIERLAPAHRGLTQDLLAAAFAADGVLVPVGPDVLARAQGTPVSIEGVKVPTGPTDPTTPGPGGRDGPGPSPSPGTAAAPSGPEAPGLVRFTAPGAPEPVPSLDGYSLRLIATRKLYDGGTLVAHSPSLAGLAPGTRLRLHPSDFDRLGIAPGSRVKVSSARGTVSVQAAADAGVPRGSAHLTVNQPGGDPAALIDATAPVTDIRIETT